MKVVNPIIHWDYSGLSLDQIKVICFVYFARLQVVLLMLSVLSPEFMTSGGALLLSESEQQASNIILETMHARTAGRHNCRL